MKCIYITCNISMLETVTTMLDTMEFCDYQAIEQVTAKSRYASPRLNTPVWPGYNCSIMLQEKDENKVNSLLGAINNLNISAYNTAEIIALYVWDITAYSQVPE